MNDVNRKIFEERIGHAADALKSLSANVGILTGEEGDKQFPVYAALSAELQKQLLLASNVQGLLLLDIARLLLEATPKDDKSGTCHEPS